MNYKKIKLALAILLIFSSSISLSCLRRRDTHPSVGLGQENAPRRFISSIIHSVMAVSSATFLVLALIHRDEGDPYLFASGAMAGSYALCMGIKRTCEEISNTD